MNGKYVLNDLDVFKTAGGENIAYDPEFTTSADRYGQIILQFIYGGADQPFIDGIEAVQSGNPPQSCTAVTAAPTGLTATATSSSSAGLTWTAPTPPANCTISSYTIYGGTTANPTTVIASGVTGTSYTNTGLAANTTYYYTVAAVDAAGTSPVSAEASVKTPSGSCTAVPSAPTGLTATGTSSTSIGLSWSAVTPPANCSISSYSVYGSTSSGFTPGSGNLLSSSVTGTSYSNTGLSASTTYYYVVEATDAEGSSAASTQATATTQSPIIRHVRSYP